MYLGKVDGVILLELIVFTFLFLFVIKEFLKIQKLQYELKLVQAKNEELTTCYDEAREIKHNIGNFVQALYGYVAVKNLNGIEEMCRKIQQEMVQTGEIKDKNIKKMCNPALENLFANKIFVARKNEINLIFECKVPLDDLQISTYDICKIIGVLLDNAIEAAASTEEKFVKIKIFENRMKRKKIIKIENSYNGNINVEKIFIKGYTSKNDNLKGHGLGLWSVKKVIESHDEIDLITDVKDKFCQQIEISF